MTTPPPEKATGGQRSGGPPAGGLGERLDGWKAIAGYLGRDVRTVQRWELGEGLPIHRLEHRQRASAYAFTKELDAWIAERAPHESEEVESPTAAAVTAHRRRPWGYAVVAAVLLILVLAGIVAGRLGSKTGTWNGDTRDPQAFAAFAEGQALYLSRQYRDATVSLERAVTRDPDYAVAWAWLAKAYGRLAQPVWAGGAPARDRATEAARRAASLAPESAEAHIALALAARAHGDVAALRAEAQRAYELDPRAAEPLAILGDSYSAVVYACHAGQDPELAESYYRRSMELAPNMTITASNRAGNLRRMGRYAECIDLLNKVIRAYRDDTPLLAVRGGCRLMLGDVAGATEDIAPLRHNPRIAAAGSLVYLGFLGLMSGDVEQGSRDLESVSNYDRSARTELIIAEVYGLAGDAERAAVHLKRAFDLDASCPAMVATSIAFKPIRHTEAVTALLESHGIR